MGEREELLEELQEYQDKQGNLDGKILLLMLALMALSLIVFVPKIYLRNNIYFTSKNIAKLQIQHDTLVEENRRLKQQLEDVKFKYLITDLGE